MGTQISYHPFVAAPLAYAFVPLIFSRVSSFARVKSTTIIRKGHFTTKPYVGLYYMSPTI